MALDNRDSRLRLFCTRVQKLGLKLAGLRNPGDGPGPRETNGRIGDIKDSLDAFGIHGMGGVLGAVLTGVFATKAITGIDGRSGLVEGDASQMLPQLVSIVAAGLISIVGTAILLKMLDALMGLRVSSDQEIQGLDISQHGEEGCIHI